MKALHRFSLALIALSLLSFQTWAGVMVQFRTTIGDIDVELFEDKPVTTANFLKYAESGAYEDTLLHRWVPGFVIQGGGYYLYDFFGWFFTVDVPSFGSITTEFNVGSRRSNLKGTIAMAKSTNSPNSATCQWFFNLGNNSANLDNQNGGFTVFGRVVGGSNVLERFNYTDNANGIFYLQDSASTLNNPVLTEFPVFTHIDPTDGLTKTTPIFLNITLMNVKVTKGTNSTMDISWNSRSNRVNVVEYTATTNATPSWQTLWRTNGNGSSMKFNDKSSAGKGRFYRVRVEY